MCLVVVYLIYGQTAIDDEIIMLYIINIVLFIIMSLIKGVYPSYNAYGFKKVKTIIPAGVSSQSRRWDCVVNSSTHIMEVCNTHQLNGMKHDTKRILKKVYHRWSRCHVDSAYL